MVGDRWTELARKKGPSSLDPSPTGWQTVSVTRLLLPGEEISLGEKTIAPNVARHAHAARVAIGEPIEILDLDGYVGVGVLLGWEGSSCRVHIERVDMERGEPPAPLLLGLGVLHTQAFDWAVEKATELGATTIVPVLAQRSQGGKHEGRLPRWQRIAAAAVAQCGRSRAPLVTKPERIEDFIARPADLRLIADASLPYPGGSHSGMSGISVLVGPEGGFTADEIALARKAGFLGVPLGPRILRAETAAVVALGVAQALAGWLSPERS
jgi:16S rRNA (uracil1498-N3)-methyltransferase